MKFLLALGASLLGLSTFGHGAVLRAEPLALAERDAEVVDLEQRQACTHGPTNRGCWTGGFSSSTDMYTSWPNTGQIRTVSSRIVFLTNKRRLMFRQYDFSITNTTCNPDGHGARICLLINNKMPGPVITANWGDTIKVTIRNMMQHNGTSIHWYVRLGTFTKAL